MLRYNTYNENLHLHLLRTTASQSHLRTGSVHFSSSLVTLGGSATEGRQHRSQGKLPPQESHHLKFMCRNEKGDVCTWGSFFPQAKSEKNESF